jgi:hypothetical protein
MEKHEMAGTKAVPSTCTVATTCKSQCGSEQLGTASRPSESKIKPGGVGCKDLLSPQLSNDTSARKPYRQGSLATMLLWVRRSHILCTPLSLIPQSSRPPHINAEPSRAVPNLYGKRKAKAKVLQPVSLWPTPQPAHPPKADAPRTVR